MLLKILIKYFSQKTLYLCGPLLVGCIRRVAYLSAVVAVHGAHFQL